MAGMSCLWISVTRQSTRNHIQKLKAVLRIEIKACESNNRHTPKRRTQDGFKFSQRDIN